MKITWVDRASSDLKSNYLTHVQILISYCTIQQFEIVVGDFFQYLNIQCKRQA